MSSHDLYIRCYKSLCTLKCSPKTSKVSKTVSPTSFASAPSIFIYNSMSSSPWPAGGSKSEDKREEALEIWLNRERLGTTDTREAAVFLLPLVLGLVYISSSCLNKDDRADLEIL